MLGSAPISVMSEGLVWDLSSSGMSQFPDFILLVSH
jgi:hypothetical protein